VNNVFIKFFILNLFFQIHKNEIDELPSVLADKIDLLPEVLMKSRASNTSKKYELAFKRWSNWVFSNSLGSGDVLPAKTLTVALYLSSLIQTAHSPAPVIAAFYAIKWFHELYGLISPTDSKVNVNILESAKRILAKPVNKKEPISINDILAVYNSMYEEKNIKNQRIICAIILAYAGFLRSAELLNIKVSDIAFEQSYMAIYIEKSKTDIYRDGHWLMIAKTGTVLCPYENILKYIKWTGLEGDDYLFCNLSKTKTGYKVRNSRSRTSYTNLRELFLNALKPHVRDITKYSLHSLRSGGATAAANSECGIKERMFKRHGRWASENVKDGYVKDNLKERLAVSLSLGL
jgi:integrase